MGSNMRAPSRARQRMGINSHHADQNEAEAEIDDVQHGTLLDYGSRIIAPFGIKDRLGRSLSDVRGA